MGYFRFFYLHRPDFYRPVPYPALKKNYFTKNSSNFFSSKVTNFHSDSVKNESTRPKKLERGAVKRPTSLLTLKRKPILKNFKIKGFSLLKLSEPLIDQTWVDNGVKKD